MVRTSIRFPMDFPINAPHEIVWIVLTRTVPSLSWTPSRLHHFWTCPSWRWTPSNAGGLLNITSCSIAKAHDLVTRVGTLIHKRTAEEASGSQDGRWRPCGRVRFFGQGSSGLAFECLVNLLLRNIFGWWFYIFPLLLENGWLTNLLRRGWKHQPDIATWWSWPVMGTQPQLANWASWSVIRTHRRMHANICRSRSSVAWMPLDIPWPQRLSAKCRMWCEQTWDSTCRSYSLFRHNQFYALKSPKQKHKIQLLKVGMTSGACSSSLTSFNKEFVIVFPKEARIYLWLLVCM